MRRRRRRAGRRLLLGGLFLAAVAAATFAAIAWRPALEPIETPAPQAFDGASVRRGAALAAIGNCETCHTAPGGAAFAGGRAVETPFGKIYATNITPEPETGIGRWSEEAFERALRAGVDRAGRHLYPAFPYDHFPKLADDDVAALYAFLMTRAPVRASMPDNALAFPSGFRPLIVAWKLLFFDKGRFEPDPSQSAEWNRGAYLAEGLAHCGACHTPRNFLGAEKRRRGFAGGTAEGWLAPALDAGSPAPVPWAEEPLVRYLSHEWDPAHGIAMGPMAPVARSLAGVAREDVRAIAAYVAAVAGPPAPERLRKGEELLELTNRADRRRLAQLVRAAPEENEAALFNGACALCHAGPATSDAGLDLALSTAVNAPDARNLVRVVVDGVRPAEGESGPFMPGFGAAFTDAQLVALAAHLRQRFSARPPWVDLEATVAAVRRDGGGGAW
jgi:mono/diheme cytochrome c family protein